MAGSTSANKKGQRTKGNVKPSSSAKAAQLLAEYGLGSNTGFVGFGEQSDGPQLNTNLRLLLRKITKKDAVTKIKALKELNDCIVEESDVELSCALSLWAKNYTKCCLDADSKVREEANNVMKTFSDKLKRQLASQIKLIMPYLLICEHDAYSGVVLAAKSALNAMFPSPDKRIQVLIFCKETILNECADLCLNTEKFLKTDAPEASTDDYSKETKELCIQRLIVCSLKVLTSLTKSLDDENLESLDSAFRKSIFEQPRFWSIVKHKNGQVKTAWFKFITILIDKNHNICRDFLTQIAPCVVNCLERQDAPVCTRAWESALICLEKFPEPMWRSVNYQKAFLPKIWSILRKGGDKMASAVGPLLLPMLAKILATAPNINVEVDHFCLKFMQNFEHGIRLLYLEQKFAYSEKANFMKAYCECLQYVLSKSDSDDLWRSILDEQFRAIVNICLPSGSSINPEELIIVDYVTKVIRYLLQTLKTKGNAITSSSEGFIDFLSVECFEKSLVDYSNPNLSRLFIHLCSNNSDIIISKFMAKICRKCFDRLFRAKDLNFDENCAHFLKIFRQILDATDDVRFLAYFENINDKQEGTKCFTDRLLALVTKIEELGNRNCAAPSVSCLLGVGKFIENDSRSDFMRKCLSFKSPLMRYSLLAALSETEKWIDFCNSSEFSACFFDTFSEMIDDLANGKETFYDPRIFFQYLEAKDRVLHSNEIIDGILSILINYLDSNSAVSIDDELLTRCVLLVVTVASLIFQNLEGNILKDSHKKLIVSLFDLHLNTELKENVRTKLYDLLGSILQRNHHTSMFFVEHLQKRINEEKMDTKKLNRFVDAAYDLFILYAQSFDKTFENISHFIPRNENWKLLFRPLNENTLWKIDCKFRSRHPPSEDLNSTYHIKPDYNFDDAEAVCRNCVYSAKLLYKLAKLDPKYVKCDLFCEIVCHFVALITFIDGIKCFHEKIDDTNFDNEFCVELLSTIEDSVQFLEKQLSLKVVMDTSLSIVSQFEGLHYYALPHMISLGGDDKQEKISLIKQFVKNLPVSDRILSYYVAQSVDFDTKMEKYDNTDKNLWLRKTTDHLALLSHSNNFDAKKDFLAALSSILSTKDFEDILLFNGNLENIDNHIVRFNSNLAILYQSLIESIEKLDSDHIDSIFCSLLAWLQTCSDSSIDITTNIDTLEFFVQIFHLYHFVNEKLTSIADEQESVPKFVQEWKEFFSPACQSILIKQFSSYFASENRKSNLIGYCIAEFSCCWKTIDGEKFLVEANFPLLLSPDLDSLGYPASFQSSIINLSNMLISKNRSFQIASFDVLKSIISKIYEYEKRSVEEGREEESLHQFPSYLTSNLAKCLNIIRPHFTSQSFDQGILTPIIHSYLLTWEIIFKYVDDSIPTELRPAYSRQLYNSDLLKDLLTTIFWTLEDFSLHVENRTVGLRSNDPEFQNMLNFILDCDSDYGVESNFFEQCPPLNSHAHFTLRELRHLACHVYFELMRLFPAAVRQWWNSSEKKLRHFVERFTSKHVSKLLCSLELQNINKSQRHYDKMTLNARTNTREIVSSYKLEDWNMELVISLPPNYPLQPVSVEATERVGVAKDKWRKWMLQLVVFLTHQNGSLLDGLLLWKSCVDKHLEGVEECTICMMAVHGSSYQLPKVTCRQCKKKFHAACLYKWFDTSNKSSCPMCRTEFSG